MTNEFKTKITKESDQSLVDAIIRDDITKEQLLLWKNEWKPLIDQLAESNRNVMSHSHWDWPWKVGNYGRKEDVKLFSLECDERLQGLMIVSMIGESDDDFKNNPKRQDLVYIKYVEAAPWNQSVYSNKEYGGVGTALIRHAMEESQQAGFNGRIGLHSVPGAVGFYKSINELDVMEEEKIKRVVYTYFETK